MADDQITKEQIYAALGKHLCEELIDHKGPLPGIYYCKPNKGEDVWITYPSSGHTYIGATRTIAISKKTGEILADQMIGE